MAAHFDAFNKQIISTVSLSDLSRGNKMQIASEILKESGVMQAMLESAFCADFCKVWREAADAYCAGKD